MRTYVRINLNAPNSPALEESWVHMYVLKRHSHAVLVNFKNKKYVRTSMNAHK